MKLVATVSSVEEIELATNADVIELRLDLGKFEKRSLPDREYIVTFRRKCDGGAYDGSDENRLAMLRNFSDVATYVDLECDLPDSAFDDFDRPIIESYHNFNETPDYAVLREMVENKRGDYFKVATLGRNKGDVEKIVKLLVEYDDVVAFLMGENFAYTRVLAALLDAPFVYCFVGKSKAPGQIELDRMYEILRLAGLR